MLFFSNLLKRVDLFGSEIKFNYKGRSTLQTHFGGIVTAIAFGLCLYLTYIFGLDIVQKDKPVTRLSKHLQNSVVDLKTFPIIFRVAQPNGAPIPNQDSLLTLDFQTLTFNTDNVTKANIITKLKNVTISKCDPDKHFGKYKEFILSPSSIVPKENIYCVDFNDYTSFYNDYGTPNSTFMDLNVKVCNSVLHNKTCGSQADIDKYLNVFYTYMYFPNNFIDPNSYLNPSTLYMDVYSQRTGKDFYRRNYFRIANTEIVTDNGLFFVEEKKETVRQLMSTRMDLDYSDADPTTKYAMTFESPRIADQYYRSYAKIQNLFANLGGLFNIILIAGKLLCMYISEYSLYFQQAKQQIFFLDLDNNEVQNMSMANEVKNSSEIQIINFDNSSKKKVKSLFQENEKSAKLAKNEDVINHKENNKDYNKDYNSTDAKIMTVDSPVVSSLNLVRIGNSPVTSKTDNIQLSFKNDESNTNQNNKNYNNNNDNNIIRNNDLRRKENRSESLKTSQITKKYLSIGFCSYIKTLFSCKVNNPDKTIYKSLIRYFEKRLDIIDLLTLRKDVFLLKSLLFSDSLCQDSLFDYKVSIDHIVNEFELECVKAEKQEEDTEDALKEKQINSRDLMRKIQSKVSQLNVFN